MSESRSIRVKKEYRRYRVESRSFHISVEASTRYVFSYIIWTIRRGPDAVLAATAFICSSLARQFGYTVYALREPNV